MAPGSGAITPLSPGRSHGHRGALSSTAGLQVGLTQPTALVGVGARALFS
ncbi:homoserine/homoserine lactone efflux protein, partial [Erwinia amylovora]|nr:homoserine/homoserine lactone efflux protein [Erwinia amylovora]